MISLLSLRVYLDFLRLAFLSSFEFARVGRFHSVPPSASVSTVLQDLGPIKIEKDTPRALAVAVSIVAPASPEAVPGVNKDGTVTDPLPPNILDFVDDRLPPAVSVIRT